jgi:hypothetical protein
MRAVLQAANTVYAPGCRAGHRAAPPLLSGDADTQQDWREAALDAVIPPADLAAGRARRDDGWLSSEQMAAAFDAGEAVDLPGLADHLLYEGGWWTPGSAGWHETPGPPLPGQQPAEDPWGETDD